MEARSSLSLFVTAVLICSSLAETSTVSTTSAQPTTTASITTTTTSETTATSTTTSSTTGMESTSSSATTTTNTQSAESVLSGNVAEQTTPHAPTVSTVSTSIVSVMPGDCQLELSDPKVKGKFEEAMQGKNKMIKFIIRYGNYSDDFLIQNNSRAFRPFQWVRSRTLQAESLLMLDDNFHVLSLSLLTIGIVTLDLTLKDNPPDCMKSIPSEDRILAVRQLLMNNLETHAPDHAESKLGKTEQICNMIVQSNNGVTEFLHHCCRVDQDGNEICQDIRRGVWISILLACIIIIKILVVLFSPNFIPQSMYRRAFAEAEYIFQIPKGKKKKIIRVVKTRNPEKYSSQNQAVRLEKCADLEHFKEIVDDMPLDKVYDLKLDTVHITVLSRKLLPENYVPVSIVKMLYENVFRCKMRMISALKPCCYSGICGDLNCGWTPIPWYKCLAIVMKIFLLALITAPWVIRLLIYFSYEAVAVREKMRAAERLNLAVNFAGSFTLYLTPLHGLFVAIYILMIIDSVAYGLLGTKMQQRFQFILRKCLRDMKEKSRAGAYAWAVGLLLWPFKKFGMVGFILAPIIWIFVLIIITPVLIFYTFPAVNLSVRLIIHLLIFILPDSFRTCLKKTCMMIHMKGALGLGETEEEDEFHSKEHMTTKEVLLQLLIIVMVLTSFWSLTFLLMECISFFVEVGVYTLMGIIVNAGATLQYVTVSFLIGMYAKDNFGKVYKKYLAYHQIIRGLLLGKKEEEIKETARQEEKYQKNTAFQVQSIINASDVSSGLALKVRDGQIQWKTSGLLVFLNKLDQPFTPMKFFFNTIDMNYCGCPGKLWENTLAAFVSFMKIMVFLLFVVIVVLAFGNQFSTTNQMLATLAGGFIPFVFRNFFARAGAGFTVDTDSVQFSAEFATVVADYKQTYLAGDLIPTSMTETGTIPTTVPEPKPVVEEAKPKPTEDKEKSEGDTDPENIDEDVSIDMDAASVYSEGDKNHVDLVVDIRRFDRRRNLFGNVARRRVPTSVSDNTPIVNQPESPADDSKV